MDLRKMKIEVFNERDGLLRAVKEIFKGEGIQRLWAERGTRRLAL
jgi:hypothetical protein